MKFFDKLNLRRFAKVAAIATVGGSILFGNTGIVSADSEGMKASREAYTAKMESTRMMDFDLMLISPNFHMDIDSRAQATADGVIKMSGELGWTYTNLEKNYSTNNRIPFYI
ncbi:MAG: hypothetical protein K6G55_09400 [Selenomonadaceae bacterium]|nr:hypothetical protein [Selenomonadaceae bacterium]